MGVTYRGTDRRCFDRDSSRTPRRRAVPDARDARQFRGLIVGRHPSLVAPEACSRSPFLRSTSRPLRLSSVTALRLWLRVATNFNHPINTVTHESAEAVGSVWLRRTCIGQPSAGSAAISAFGRSYGARW